MKPFPRRREKGGPFEARALRCPALPPQAGEGLVGWSSASRPGAGFARGPGLRENGGPARVLRLPTPGSDGRARPGPRPACLPTHGPHMNFHEYQAKQLFADYGIAVPAGRVARTPEEAVDAAKAIGGDFWVVKAQIHAGGRGKAGGVKLARTLDEVREYAKGMLGH